MIRTIFFDCFGVLIVDAFEALVTEARASDPAIAEELRRVSYASNHGQITSEEAKAEYISLLHITLEEFQQKVYGGEAKNQAVLEFAGSLRPKYKTAVLSNASRGGLERRFAPGELAKYFDAWVVSGEIGFAKPEARAYEIAADRLDARLEECVMIDDRQEYCDGAVAVGMRAIRFEDVAQLKRELGALLSQG